MEPLSKARSLDQERAAFAWKRIQSHKSQFSDSDADDYVGEARKLPIRTMASGLGQALAFLYAKQEKKPGVKLLLSDLAVWVLDQRQLIPGVPAEGKSEARLIEAIVSDGSNSQYLRRATAEVLAILVWVNRFAEGRGLAKNLAENTD